MDMDGDDDDEENDHDEEGEDGPREIDEDDGFLDEDKTFADLDDEDKADVFDGQGWSDAVQDGYTIETGHMDVLDRLMAHAFTESFKTADGSFTLMDDPAKISPVPIPQPRTMRQLLYAMEPNIRGSELGSAGHTLGETAWSVRKITIFTLTPTLFTDVIVRLTIVHAGY